MSSVLLLAPLPDFLLEPLQASFACHDWFHAADREALLARVGPEIRAVTGAGGTVYAEALLQRLPTLEIIAVFGVGYDGVPLDWCRRHGVRVTNTPDVLTDDVADIATALVLMTSRQLGTAERYVRAGRWPLEGALPLADALRGKTAGILGLGRIGKAIARRLEAHGMSIAYHGRQPQAVDWKYADTLEGLAAEADFLIVACPGGEAAQRLVSTRVLEALGPEGTLINIARGSVVDEPALIAALKAGKIRGAGLDVFAEEPRVPKELLADERVVLLPHVGSATNETRGAMARLVADNLQAHFAGRPLLTPVA